MLPTLSDKLQLLQPVTIAPCAVSARRNALLELKKLDTVLVGCAARRDWFVVEVQADSSTASSDPAVEDGARLRRPTARTERTLLEFVALRDKVYDIVHAAHNSEPCAFCAGILDLIVFGANPDGFLVGLLGGKRMARTLTKFMEELLTLTVQNTCTDVRGCCSGQTDVPQVVHAFLFVPASDAA